MSLRTSQAARGMFSVKEQQALNDCMPYIQSGLLTAATANVNASTAFIDSGLYCEMSSAIAGSPLGSAWYITGSIIVSTTAAAGVQLQIVGSDGLNIVSGTINYALFAAGGVAAGGASGGSPFTGGATNVVYATFSGVLTVTGAGRCKLQFTQAVSTAVNTSLSANSYMEARTILP